MSGLVNLVHSMMSATCPDGSCILTTSRFYMASGEPPGGADVARLWDTETGALLREWRFGYGNPDSAFFAGHGRFVVLSAGDGFVYQIPLCGSLVELRQLATSQFSSAVHADAPAEGSGGRWDPVYDPAIHPDARVEGPNPQPSHREPPSEPESPAPMPSVAAPASLTEAPIRPHVDTATAPPIAPSFSCSGKLTPVEALICNDAGLAKLDLDLSQAYRKKMQDLQGKDRQRLVLEQRAWLKERAGCVSKGDLKQCVEDSFRRRRAALGSR